MIEGLALALAPSRLDQVMAMLSAMSAEKRRRAGLAMVAGGGGAVDGLALGWRGVIPPIQGHCPPLGVQILSQAGESTVRGFCISTQLPI